METDGYTVLDKAGIYDKEKADFVVGKKTQLCLVHPAIGDTGYIWGMVLVVLYYISCQLLWFPGYIGHLHVGAKFHALVPEKSVVLLSSVNTQCQCLTQPFFFF